MLKVMATIAGFLAAKGVASVSIFRGQIFARSKRPDIKELKNKYQDLNISFSQMKTNKNRVLDLVEVASADNSTKGVIIVFNGSNATIYKEKKLDVYCALAKDTGYTIIGFNYGGTGKGYVTTWSSRSLINDGFYLAMKMAENMPKNNALILKGNSLGGAMATKAAKLCHEAGNKVYLWNGRSYNAIDLLQAVRVQTQNKSGHYENQYTRILSKIAYPFFKLFFFLTDFVIEVGDDYGDIPSNYKNFYIVRSNEQERVIKKDDVTVPYLATLDTEPRIVSEINRLISMEKSGKSSDISFYRKRRYVTATHANDAHATSEKELFNPDDKRSVYNLFCLFSEYVTDHNKNLNNNKVLK